MAKRTVRQGAWETNSSSTHAICISNTQKIEDIKLPKEVEFGHDEFDWEFEIYHGVSSKANYLNEALAACYEGEELFNKKVQIYTMLKEKGVDAFFEPDEYNVSYWKLNSDWYKDEEVEMDYSYDNGYIDHGSETKEFVDAVLNDSDLLIKYLFGNSFVVTGNDNSSAFGDYMYKDDDKYWDSVLKDEFNDYMVFEKGN